MADEAKTQKSTDKRARAAAKYRAWNEEFWSEQLLGGKPLRGPKADFDQLIATFRKRLQVKTRDQYLLVLVMDLALSVLPLLYPRGPGKRDSLDQRGNDNDPDNRAGRKASKD